MLDKGLRLWTMEIEDIKINLKVIQGMVIAEIEMLR